MATIDNRIVQMQFDNAQFERGVNQTIKTLGSLDKNLSTLNNSHALDKLQTAADVVTNKFSLLGTVADEVIRRVTDGFLNAAKTIATKFTLQPAIEGFNTYETKVAATQQLMHSASLTEKEALGYLQELNTYSDKTIYSFNDMTSSIGKFTAAGVDVKDATDAIKGLGNVAALSGANTADFSRAIYNVSQALGSGYMLARDWMSIENANMATKDFKETLKQTAVEMGTLSQSAADAMGLDVRGTLQDKWLTSDVLIASLQKYADEETEIGKAGYEAATKVKTFHQMLETFGDSAATSWSKLYEAIFGTYEQASKIWTPMEGMLEKLFADPVSNFADRIETLNKDVGFMKKVISGIADGFEGLEEIVSSIGEAFKWVFGDLNINKLLINMASNIQKSGKTFKEFWKNSEEGHQILDNLVDSIGGALSVIRIIGKTIQNVFYIISPLGQLLKDIGKWILKILSPIGTLLNDLDLTYKKSSKVQSAVEFLHDGMQKLVDITEKAIDPVVRFIAAWIKTKDIHQAADAVSDTVNKIKKKIEELALTSKFINGLKDAFTWFGDKVKKVADFIGQCLSELFHKSDETHKKVQKNNKKTIDVIDLLGKAFGKVKDFASTAYKEVGKFFDNVAAYIKSLSPEQLGIALDSIVGALVGINLTRLIKDSKKLVNTFGKKGLINTLLGNGLKTFKSNLVDTFKDLTAPVSDFLDQLQVAVKKWQKTKTGGLLKSIAQSILILAGAMLVIAMIPKDKLVGATVAITGMMAEMAIITKYMNTGNTITKNGKEITASLGDAGSMLIKLSIAMLILADALAKVAKLPIENTVVAFTVISGMLVELIAITKAMSEIKITEKKAINLAKVIKSLILVAIVIQMLVLALKTVAKLPIKNVVVAFTVISALLVEMVALLEYFSKMKITSKKAANVAKAIGSLILVALALQMLVIPLAALSLIPAARLAMSVTSLLAMLVSMVAVVKYLSQITSKQAINAAKSAASLIIVATAIDMLAIPLMALSVLNTGKLLVALTSILAMLVSMVAVVKYLSQITSKQAINAAKSAASLIIVATAIDMLAIPLMALSVLNTGKLLAALTSILVMLVSMVAVVKYLSQLTKAQSEHAAKNALSLIIVATSLSMVAASLALLSLMPLDGIIASVIALSSMLIVLVGSLEFISKIDTKSLMTAATALTVVAGAIGMIELPIQMLAAIDLIQMAASFGVLSAMLIELVIVLKYIADIPTGNIMKASGAIILLATALNLIAIPLMALSVFPFSRLIGAVGALTIALGALVGVIAILGKIPLNVSIAGAAILVGVCLGLAASLYIVGKAASLVAEAMNNAGTGMVKMAAGIAALAAAAPLAEQAFGVIKLGIEKTIEAIAMMIPMIAQKLALGVVTFVQALASLAPMLLEALGQILLQVLDQLSYYTPQIVATILNLILNLLDQLVTYAPQLVEKLCDLIIGLIGALSEKIPDIVVAFLNFFGSLMNGIKQGFETVGSDVILQAIETMGLIAALMAACAALQSIALLAMQGLLALAVFTAGLTLVIAAIGALSQLPGLKWLIGEGGNILQLVGTAIGQFVGGIVGGFAEGISSTFPQIATDLSNFMTNLQPFINGATQLNPDMLDGVNALVKTILLITAAEIIQGITSFLTGGNDLASFGSQIAELGTYFSQFAKNVSGLDESTVDKANICAKSIKTLAEAADAIPNSGGLAGIFAGNNDIDDFGKQLKSFGKAFVDFANTVSGIDSSVVQNAKIVADSAKVISDMAKDIPNSGGVVSWFTGNNDLDDFGDKLRSFGLAFYSFAQAIANINPNVSTNAQSVADAAKVISDMAKDIPNSGGLISWFTGDNDLGTFGENLQTFGNAFAAFGNSVGAIDSSAIESATNEFGKIIGLANLASAADTSGFDKFKEAFEKLGTDSINNFVNTFDGASEKVKTAIDKLISTAQNELNSGTSGILMAGTSLGTALSMGITNGINSNAGALILSVRSIGAQITLLAKTSLPAATFSSIALTNIIQPLAQGITGNQMLVIYAIQILISQIKITFMSYLSMAWFLTLGYTINQYLATGMRSGMGLIIAAAISMCSTIRSTFYANLNLYDVGQYAAQGLANGITSKINDIANAAIAAAKAAVDAAHAELDEHSPSKVFYQIGQFIDQGLINGIDDYRTKVYNSGTNLGRAVIESMNSSLENTKGLFDLGINGNPVIRPVLDLSDIDAKSDKIDSLFDGVNNLAATINLNGTISRAQIAASSFSNASTNQNGVNNNTPVGNNFNFVQNNYSPKALSRKEIYRQTRNQFSVIQGAMNSV